jgi:formylglycine-generating enzyme required for sulfatase activity
MATGEKPFKGTDTIAILSALALDNPPPPRTLNEKLPKELSDLVMQLLAKKPEERSPSAQAVVEALQEIENQQTAERTTGLEPKTGKGKGGGTTQRGAAGTQPDRSAKERLRLSWLVAGGLLGLALLAAAILVFWQTPQGTVQIESDDPSVEIVFDKTGPTIKGASKEPITLPAGKHGLLIKRGDFSFETNMLVIQKGETITLKIEFLPGKMQLLQDGKVIASREIPPAKEYTNSLGMKLVYIPPGKFTMGSSQEEIDAALKLVAKGSWEEGCIKSEGPQHEVQITQGFYFGETEVTFGQFRQFVEEAKYNVGGGGGLWKKPGWEQTDNHPVVFVDWKNAVAFCRWLSKKEGRKYRLPTEAEWEYSCRAGTKTRYSFGENERKLLRYAWINTNSQGKPQPVKGLDPNPWKLHDMHGNVWEWCQDVYDPNYYKTSPPKDPPGSSAGGVRVLRGGSWHRAPMDCRSAFRFRSAPGHRDNYIGFRVVLEVPRQSITNTLGMRFMYIPPRKFTMGSSQEEIDRALKLVGKGNWEEGNIKSEGPEHEVEITHGFYMGETEVTFGQFRQFVEDSKYKVGDDRWKKPGWEQTDNHPVVWVDWKNAVDFCLWLSKKERKKYRLPTEAEWEYCCRAGTKTRYAFGDNEGDLPRYAWIAANSMGKPQPVKGLDPNPWKLHDMHGNVWEWCQDVYDPNYYKISPPKDPPGLSAGGQRVFRGGSWNSAPVHSRSAFRYHTDPGSRHDYVGFRVVLVPSPPAGVRP